MTPEETVQLVAYVEELCPSQKIGEFTPDAWHEVLGRWPLADCRSAVTELLARGERWVNVGDIAAEVRRIRNLRLENSELAIPPVDPNRAIDYRDAMGRILEHLGNGQQPMPFRAIEAGRVAGAAGPNTEYRDVREDADERRKAAVLAAARVEVDWSKHATCDECTALLDPDGSCFACTHAQANTAAE